MEKEIEFIKEMRSRKVSRKEMTDFFMKEFFPDIPCNFDYFNKCWVEAHKKEKAKEISCKRCDKLRELINKAEEMGYDNLFIKTIKMVLR